jgi:predicted AAA+ superfamily ATPase
MESFRRDILSELENWRISPVRKPLVLRGARQVGKTTVVKMFARQFDQFIYLNLERSEEARLFVELKDFSRLVEGIFFVKSMKRSGGSTLIFIDEIQQVPEAVNTLRYFYEDAPDLYVIAAGSLLETLLDEKVTVPVGRVEYRVIRPVSFREFLEALGEQQALQQLNKIPTDEFAYMKLWNLFHRYAIIGGMPEVVSHYIRFNDLTLLKPIYESLLVSYINDVEKYARNATLTQVIRHTIKASFAEAGKRIAFQHFGNSNYGSREEGEALRTLEKAMLVHLVYPTVHPQLPILPDYKKSPRLHVIDTGLMNHFVGLQRDMITTRNLQEVYQGRMIEHLVGQELLANHFNVLFNLSFWVRQKKDASAEVDYVMDVEGNLIPIEVKSGAVGKLRSLHLYMERAPHAFAVRLYGGDLTMDRVHTPSGKPFYLLSLPYFLASQTENYVRWMMNNQPIAK